ncbi:hypothetical protein COLO4_28392 [Corchorus olitorius]|uniref:Uncharacterized protein n=1 Tax=Corchorus olitorius TaxID=93759 RepID=A0A1R3HLA3_9ROSI|nr:hypothetical protein COLO4_28392 [Corchorus olitorius]
MEEEAELKYGTEEAVHKKTKLTQTQIPNYPLTCP